MNKIKIIALVFTVFILLISCDKSMPSVEESVQSEDSAPITLVAPIPEASQSEPIDSEEFLLHAKKSGEVYPVDGCIVNAFSIIFEESDFPDREAAHLAREAVYSNENWLCEIDNYNKAFPDAPIEIVLEFICGAYEDFDGDGKKESVILVGDPKSSTMFIERYLYVYVKENNAVIFMGSLDLKRFELLVFGDVVCASVARTWGTGLGSGEAIYTFSSVGSESMFYSLGGRHFTYERGYFKCYDYYRFIPDWQSIAIWDSGTKTLRELGIEEISREDFRNFFENDSEGLERFEAATGRKNYKIYTQGYVYFFLYIPDDQAFIFWTDENGEAMMKYDLDSLQLFDSHYLETKDSMLYGINANNLKPIYPLDLPDKTIDRINELTQKSKTFGEGLTEGEQVEFEILKNEYLTAIKR